VLALKVQQGQVDLGGLVGRIRDEFPDLRFAKATLNDQGEDHAVVLLDDRWVFRFPRTAVAVTRGAYERRLLATLNAASAIATPRYDHVSSAGDFGVYWMIAGRELREPVFAALPPEGRERVLSEIGGFLRVLHSLPAELVAPTAGVPGAEDAAWFAKRFSERRNRLGAALGSLLERVGIKRHSLSF
jgi:aminoglycoside phosphotransferase (APT) family kinase protein